MSWCRHLFRFLVLKSYNYVRMNLSRSLNNSGAWKLIQVILKEKRIIIRAALQNSVCTKLISIHPVLKLNTLEVEIYLRNDLYLTQFKGAKMTRLVRNIVSICSHMAIIARRWANIVSCIILRHKLDFSLEWKY